MTKSNHEGSNSMKRWSALVVVGLLWSNGCAVHDALLDRQRHFDHKHQPQITAVSADPCEPEGFPYYLPKPILILTKNVDYIDDPEVGAGRIAPIPNTFANQDQFGQVAVNFSSSPAAVQPAMQPAQEGDGKTKEGDESGDGKGKAQAGIASLVEETTGMPLAGNWAGVGNYTARIVLVPDLSQKYFLRVTGGPGEIRASLNLVNGWMFTGPGPYYQKDSSKAQNVMAWGAALKLGGQGAAYSIRLPPRLCAYRRNGGVSPALRSCDAESQSRACYSVKTVASGALRMKLLAA